MEYFFLPESKIRISTKIFEKIYAECPGLGRRGDWAGKVLDTIDAVLDLSVGDWNFLEIQAHKWWDKYNSLGGK